MESRPVTALARRGWIALLVGLGWLAQGAAWAQDDKDSSLPLVFLKSVPENPKDLRAIEKHVKGLLKKTMPATVGLLIGGAQGSGVIISKDGLVLTAGHVSGDAGRKVTIFMPDGRKLNGKTLS